jgi:hypothetical protein
MGNRRHGFAHADTSGLDWLVSEWAYCRASVSAVQLIRSHFRYVTNSIEFLSFLLAQ